MSWDVLCSPLGLSTPLLAPGGGWTPAEPFGSEVAAGGGGLCGSGLELAAAALRHAPLLILVALQFYAVGVGAAEAPSSGAAEEACSKTLGFNDTLIPKDRAFQDLQFCDEHHRRTCCEKNHTAKIRTAWSNYAVESSPRCATMGRLAFCAACDGDVGAGDKSAANSILLCPSFCRRWFEACLDDFFAAGAAGLQACGPGTLVCSPLREIAESAAEFCLRLGAPLGASFAVAGAEQEPEGCFDGIPAARSKGSGPKAPFVRPTSRSSRGAWWERFVPRSATLNRWSYKLQEYGPNIIVAAVAIFFGWYLWNNRE